MSTRGRKDRWFFRWENVRLWGEDVGPERHDHGRGGGGADGLEAERRVGGLRLLGHRTRGTLFRAGTYSEKR